MSLRMGMVAADVALVARIIEGIWCSMVDVMMIMGRSADSKVAR